MDGDDRLMTPNLLKAGVLTENSAGIGTVTRKMVRERAVELAAINGHSTQEVSKSDWEQAKRELTGEPAPDVDRQEQALEAAPESERWDPVPGSAGRQAPVSAGEDEDEEGRSDNTNLTEEGMAGAEHDQMRQAAGDAARQNS
jgi:hypothetical protein